MQGTELGFKLEESGEATAGGPMRDQKASVERRIEAGEDVENGLKSGEAESKSSLWWSPFLSTSEAPSHGIAVTARDVT